MADDPASDLFEFATSKRAPRTNEEETLMELHAALGTSRPPFTISHPPLAQHPSNLRRFLHVAVAAALIVAFLGTSFRFLNAPTGTDQNMVPSVVLGLASPDLSPNANACDGVMSIPLITGATSAPDGIVALLLTPDGDLMLDCEGDQQILESGVTAVTAMLWPGMVMLRTDEGISYLNIFTRDSYDVGDTTALDSPESPLMIYSQRSTNRFTIVPASDSPTNAAILDLESFQATNLTDHDGNPIPLSRIPVVGGNYQGDCMVVAYSTRISMQNTDYLGGFVVVNPDGQSTSIAAAGIQNPIPREVAVSPDCETFASVSFQGQQQTGTTTLTIQSIHNQSEPVQLSIDSPDWLTHSTWLKSGEGIAFAGGENLSLWNTPFADTEPVTAAEGISIDDISLTRDPNIIVVSAMDWTPEPDEIPERTLIVNTSTGDITTLESTNMYQSRSAQPRERNVLLMRTAPVEVYDSATGNHLGQIGDDTIIQQNQIVAGPDPFNGAEIALAGSSFDDLWRVLDRAGEPVMEKIEPPTEMTEVTHPNAAMSSDGWVFLAPSFTAESGWLRNTDDPNGSWTEITFDPAATYTAVQFVQRGDQSSHRTPHIPGLAIQSPTASASCFEDDPLILFGNNFPVDFPTLLVTGDGTLKLRCSAASDPVVLDTDVVWANTTAVPGTILINKPSDAPRQNPYEPAVSTTFLNLQTGARLDLGVTPEGTIFRQDEHSPWYVAPAPDDTEAIIVVDLRTLERHTILTSAHVNPATGAIVSASDDGTITAIALVTPSSLSGGGGFVVGRSDEHPEVLILHDSFTEGQWLTLTTPNGPVDDLLFSPDGAYLALEVVDGQNTYGIKRAIQSIVIDPVSGDTITSSELATDFAISSQAWGLDSRRFIYVSGTQLYVLEPATSAEPRLVVEAAGGVEGLMLTPDPDIVIVNVRTPLQEPIASSHRVSLVRGEMEMLGATTAARHYPVQTRTPMITTFDGTTVRYIDAATGEILVESTHPADTEGEATPTGTYPTVNLYLKSPVLTRVDTTDLQMWVWGDDLQMWSMPVPPEPEDQLRYLATTTADGRFVILLNSKFVAADGTPIDPSTSGPAEVVYILDTQAEEPMWIPAS